MSETVTAERIQGAWSLRAWRIDYSDGRASTFPFGEDATGLLLYSADGHMSAGISRARRGGFGGGSVRHADVEARARAFDSHFHYQGRFTIEGGNVVHAVSGALNPDFIGTRQVRAARLEGDTLELSAEDTLPDTAVRRRHVLSWRRVRD
jgi:hypothetical protein